MENMGNRPFQRLPQGGCKMFTDGQKPVFEEDPTDRQLWAIHITSVVVVIIILTAVILTK